MLRRVDLDGDLRMSSGTTRRRFLGASAATLALAAAGLGSGCAQAQAGASKLAQLLPSEGSLPSLDGATDWLNSPPLSAAGLHGKVVLVNFWTLTCINWLRQLPYVRAWSEKYRDQGLLVLGVHTPEFSFEHNIDNVRRSASAMRVDYPIAVDNDYAVWNA